MPEVSRVGHAYREGRASLGLNNAGRLIQFSCKRFSMANKSPVTPSSVRKQTKGPRSPSPLGKDSLPMPVPAEEGVLPLKTPAFDPRLLLTKLSAGRSRHEYLPS